MWGIHHRDSWPDLDAREEPNDGGTSVLNAGGFVLADPFETLLRSLSQDYLRDAWQRLSSVLARYDIAPHDLSWGHFHPGVTRVRGMDGIAPSCFIGWTSRELKDFDQDRRYLGIDAELSKTRPAMHCAVGWRSLKWNIAPDEFALGLRLIEAMATDDISGWAPNWILQTDWALQTEGTAGEAWADIAWAIDALDQDALDRALAHARDSYSESGYRIVVKGFGVYIRDWNLPMQFPEDVHR